MRTHITRLHHAAGKHGSHLAFVFIVGGLLLSASTAYDIARVVHTKGWSVTSGTVTFLSLRPDSIVLELPQATRRGGGIVNQLYLRYTYEVANHSFTGSRFSVLPPNAYPVTSRMMRTYQKGTTVTVHYDPTDPSSSVLNAQVPGTRVLELIVGLVIAAFVGYMRYAPPRRTFDRPWHQHPSPPVAA